MKVRVLSAALMEIILLGGIILGALVLFITEFFPIDVTALVVLGLLLIFGLVTQILLANQVASGLALTMFGLGLASLLGHSYTGIKPPYLAKPEIPLLADIPILGRVLFQHDFVVYFSIISVVIVWYVLKKTRLGLIIKAVGENQESAHALGYNVIKTRIYTIMVGGAFAGLGGGYLSLVRVPNNFCLTQLEKMFSNFKLLLGRTEEISFV